MNKRKYPQGLKEEVAKAMTKVEKVMGKKFGDATNPLLVSVRSGARKSMPGMMETVLNVGLTSKTIPGMIAQTGGNERFVYDAYRRLIMMYSDVVMEKAAGIEPKDDMGIRRQLEHIMDEMKKERGATLDTDLTAADLKSLCDSFKAKVKEVLGKEFPDDADKQLWGGIDAVFASWNGKRAISYRRIENIPDEWGTAVNVQSMVFGNMGEDSATGVAFSRNPATGENKFYGEWLVNAQGEDVVAGIRTPNPLNESTKGEQNKHLASLETAMPKVYKELDAIQKRLEKHYHDMQDIEFTIEKGRLWMLQCRVGKRNGPAAVRMAVDMVKEKLIKKEEAVMRVTPAQLDELLHPIIDPKVEKDQKVLAKGLPAGPGGATGQVVFTADDAVNWTKDGKKVILVREETNPEDVEGMRAAQAILTQRGGMTSHAALVARGWGKCCIVGCGSPARRPGEEGAAHRRYRPPRGRLDHPQRHQGQRLRRTTADDGRRRRERGPDGLPEDLRRGPPAGRPHERRDPADAAKARAFGAEGIGLFRTEHMFYGKDSDEPLFILRKMIMSKSEEERKKAVDELFPYVKRDIKGTMEVMDGLPVVVRLLDPPLHEFVPEGQEKRQALANSLGIDMEELSKRADALHESNPMMGHRGVRLGVTYPEVTAMQARAVFESAAELLKAGKKPYPEIMIPVVCDANEIRQQQEIITAGLQRGPRPSSASRRSTTWSAR